MSPTSTVFKFCMRPMALASAIVFIAAFRSGTAQDYQDFTWIHRDDFREIISGMVEDRRGFLWIGTLNGLYRYDGRDIVRLDNHKLAQRLRSDRIRTLALRGPELWIGYPDLSEAGLSVWNTETNQVKDIKSKYFPCEIAAFYDADSVMLIGTGYQGLLIYSFKTGRVRQVSLRPHISKKYSPELQRRYNSVYGICRGKDSWFYLATHDGLYRYDILNSKLERLNTTNEEDPFRRDDLFTGLIGDGGRGFWIYGYRSGLVHYDPETGHANRYRYEKVQNYSNIISCVQKIDNNRLILGTSDRGLVHFDTESKAFTSVKGQPDLGVMLMNQVHTFMIDKGRNLWVGWTSGLTCHFPQKKFIEFNPLVLLSPPNGPYYSARKIYHDSERKRIFIATLYADGLQMIDASTSKRTNFQIKRDAQSSQRLFSLAIVGTDSLLVTSGEQVLLFDLERLKWIPFPQPEDLKKSEFQEIIVDKKNVWITSFQNGVYRVDLRKRKYEHFLSDSTLDAAENQVVAVLDAKDHNYFVRSTGEILSMRKNSATAVSVSPPMQTAITSALIDSQGRIWLAGLRGIIVLKYTDGHMQILPTPPSDAFQSSTSKIIMDQIGNIWAIGTIGLSRIDSRTFEPATFDYDADFNISNGIANFSLSDSALYIGTVRGYFTLNPYLVEVQRQEITPTIRSFKSNGIEVPDSTLRARQTISFEHHQNNIAIEYGGVSLTKAHRIKYAYLLAGLDQDWNYVGNRSFVSYNNLPTGRYSFKVKASNPNGLWSDEVEEVNFEILAPIWLRRWFITLSVLAVGFVAVALFRWRIAQVREQEKLKRDYELKISQSQIRALQAQMNPHFIFNFLNSVNYFILQSKPGEASDYLAKYSKLVRLFLDELNEEYIKLSNQILSIDLYIQLEKLRFGGRLSYSIEVDEKVNPEEQMIPSMVIQPFIENAIIHGIQPLASQGLIKVEFRRTDVHLICIIEDNGIGRNSKNPPNPSKRRSYGISLSRERLKLLQPSSSIEIIDLKNENGDGAGTRIIILFEVNI